MKNQITETWKQFRTTLQGNWEVSNLGNVRIVNNKLGKIRYVRSYYSGGNPGSRYLCLSCNEVKYVHRAVAEAFVFNPNPSEFNCVDHINGIKEDNRAENLRWTTREENLKSYFRKKYKKVKTGK